MSVNNTNYDEKKETIHSPRKNENPKEIETPQNLQPSEEPPNQGVNPASNESRPKCRDKECYQIATSCCIDCLLCKAPHYFCDYHLKHFHDELTKKFDLTHSQFVAIEKHFQINYLKTHEPTLKEFQKDKNENLYLWLTPEDKLSKGPKFVNFQKESETIKDFSLICFVGGSGTGKSTLIKMIADEPHPISSHPFKNEPTSSDVHVYRGSEALSKYGFNKPLLIFDSEGTGANKERTKVQSSSHLAFYLSSGNQTFYQKAVNSIYPRLLYLFSNILCFPFTSEPKQREEILKPLLEYGRAAASRSIHHLYKPALIVIFNKKSKDDILEWGDIQKATCDFTMNHEEEMKELKQYYREIHVIWIPHYENEKLFFDQIEKFQRLVAQILKDVQTRISFREFSISMSKAVEKLQKDPDSELNLYDLYSDAFQPKNHADHLFKYFKSKRQFYLKNYSPHESFNRALKDLTARLPGSLLLSLLTSNEESFKLFNFDDLTPTMKEVTSELSKLIEKIVPCVGHKEFKDEKTKQIIEVRCEYVNENHPKIDPKHSKNHSPNQHKSLKMYHAIANSKWIVWKTYQELPCVWDGDFERLPCDLNFQEILKKELQKLKKTFYVEERQKEMKDIYVEMDKLIPKDFDQIDKDFYPDSSFCLSCLTRLPVATFSCGHLICEKCGIFWSKRQRCPFSCKSITDWKITNLPSRAGYRILSLDGGGVRGLIECMVLEKIVKNTGLQIPQLFDFVSGTSIGGIITLGLLTDSPSKKQPQTPEEMHKLILEVAKKVFGESKRNSIASLVINLYEVFQKKTELSGWYDRKALDELIDINLKKEPTIQSFYGPKFAIPACSTQGGSLEAVIFTNYNLDPPQFESADSKWDEIRIDFLISGVAKATSAAPTYFDFFEGYSDGGLVANCPAGIAIKHAHLLWPKSNPDFLLSLGNNAWSRGKIDDSQSFLGSMKQSFTDPNKGYQDAITQLSTKFSNEEVDQKIMRYSPKLETKFDMDSSDQMKKMEEETEKVLEEDKDLIEKISKKLMALYFYVESCDIQNENFKICVKSRGKLSDRLLEDLKQNKISFNFSKPIKIQQIDQNQLKQKKYSCIFIIDSLKDSEIAINICWNEQQKESEKESYPISGMPFQLIEFESEQKNDLDPKPILRKDFRLFLSIFEPFFENPQEKKKLDLSFRSLMKLDFNFEKNILTSLNLSNNQLRFIPNLRDLQVLTDLDLSFNKITMITKFSFFPISLEKLDLSSNLIYFIDFDSFNPNQNLKNLNLKDNPLAKNQIDSLKVNKNIVSENILEQDFSSLVISQNYQNPDQIWEYLNKSDFKQFQFIGFSKSPKLKFLHSLFESSKALEILDVSYIGLERFLESENSDFNLPFVQNLFLDHNRFDSISNLKAEKLEKLFAGFNQIEKINFLPFSFLKELHLNNNNISFLDDHLFEKTPQLSILNLAHNNLRQLPSSLSNLENLIEFYVSNNGLCDFPILPSNLIKIDLSFNQISEIKEENINHFKYLNHLKLNHNGLKSYPLVSNIPFLNLIGNKLSKKPLLDQNCVLEFDPQILESNIEVLEKSNQSLKLFDLDISDQLENSLIWLKILDRKQPNLSNLHSFYVLFKLMKLIYPKNPFCSKAQNIIEKMLPRSYISKELEIAPEYKDLDKEIQKMLRLSVSPKGSGFFDLIGMEELKKELINSVITPILNPQLVEKKIMEPVRSILFYGPPGTGKTFLIEALSKEIKMARLFKISSSDLKDSNFGQGEKNIKALFIAARLTKPCIVFIDEIDTFLKKRDSSNTYEATQTMLNVFLEEYDPTKPENEGILLIGAASRPYEIDPMAMKLFRNQFYFPSSDFQIRKKFLQELLKQKKEKIPEKDIEEIAKKTENYSMHDLTLLIKEASRIRNENLDLTKINLENIPDLKKTHLEEALRKVTPSFSKEDQEKLLRWKKEMKSFHKFNTFLG